MWWIWWISQLIKVLTRDKTSIFLVEVYLSSFTQDSKFMVTSKFTSESYSLLESHLFCPVLLLYRIIKVWGINLDNNKTVKYRYWGSGRTPNPVECVTLILSHYAMSSPPIIVSNEYLTSLQPRLDFKGCWVGKKVIIIYLKLSTRLSPL